jgi:pimeloyl-ACP methyl ester carboxylesterase
VQVTKVQLTDVELELLDAGEGPPVLFLHGGGGFDRRQEFVELLSRQHRLLAPSHPGFGNSGLPDWLDSVDDIAHLYLELLDRLNLDTVDVIGCSIGGWIAAEMATKTPQRIRRLVMVAPVGIKTGPSDQLDIPDIFAMPEAELAKLLYHDPARMQVDRTKMSDAELSVMFRNRETLALLTWEPYMHNPKLRHRLHRVALPALLLRGASDGIVSADYLARYAALLPKARIETIAQAGHLPHVEQRETTAAAVLHFLNSRQAGGRPGASS